MSNSANKLFKITSDGGLSLHPGDGFCRSISSIVIQAGPLAHHQSPSDDNYSFCHTLHGFQLELFGLFGSGGKCCLRYGADSWYIWESLKNRNCAQVMDASFGKEL